LYRTLGNKGESSLFTAGFITLKMGF